MGNRVNLALLTALCIARLPAVTEAAAPGPPRPLEELALEELLAIDVTSVSRKGEKRFQAASAIDVLTEEEIRRSGAPNVPEALRYATGTHVAHYSPRAWAISIRGFNNASANKLEVMMDGRSVYSPFFSGVLWDGVDYAMEDLDRIEVIRGPGATMWGANAVNGVISIYTKGAEETQGGIARSVAGLPDNVLQSARYGFQLSDRLYARVWAKYWTADEFRMPNGEDSPVAHTEMFHAGFRSDFLASEDSRLVTEGALFTDGLGVKEDEYQFYEGGHLFARWEQSLSSDASYQLQAYYDRYDRNYFILAESRETADVSAQHRYLGIAGHDIVSGIGYRYSWDETEQVSIPYLEPRDEGFGVFNVFVQDEVEWREDLSVMLGAKYERNSLVDRWEFQPSARASWMLSDRAVLWGAVSRAVRTPARADTDLRWIQPGLELYGQDDYKSEKALSFELGQRYRWSEELAAEVSLFFTDYDNLPTLEPQGDGVYFYQNMQEGETWGGEVSFDYRASYRTRFSLDVSYLRQSFQLMSGSRANPASAEASLGNDPTVMATLGALFELPEAVELSGYLRYVSDLPQPEVPGYLELDLRLAWAPRPWVEVALVGRSLLDKQRLEFIGQQTPRRVQLQTSFKF